MPADDCQKLEITPDDLQHSTSAPPLMTSERGTQWSSEEDDNSSIGSASDSEPSKLEKLIKKAKAKGRKILHRNKKRRLQVDMVDQSFQTDISPIETVEESKSAPIIDCNIPSDPESDSINSAAAALRLSAATFSALSSDHPTLTPADLQVPDEPVETSTGNSALLFKFRLVLGLILVVLTIFVPYWVASFFWGIYVTIFATFNISSPKQKAATFGRKIVKRLQSVLHEAKRQKILKESICYRGWMNELRKRYNPLSYSVTSTRSVVVELEGRELRISQPKKNVYRHTFFNDPTLESAEPAFVRRRVYDLTDATISLRPRGLARKRWWFRKYPIVIKLTQQTQFENDSSDSDSDHSDSDSEWLHATVSTSGNEVRQRLTVSRSTHDLRDPKMFEEESTGSDFKKIRKIREGVKRVVLFARSSREKERWFHRLRQACSMNRTGAEPVTDADMKRASNLSLPSLIEQSGGLTNPNLNLEYYLYVSYGMQFSRTMADVTKSASVEYSPDSGIIHMDLGRQHWSPKPADYKSEVVLAANAIVSRVFFDFCRDERWVGAIRNKIQVKLSTLELPYYIETLTLSQLKLGTTIPQVIGVHSPVLNDWGLWVDVEIKYDGGLQLVFETKVDLSMMLEANPAEFRKAALAQLKLDVHRHYSDSDLSISPEHSDNENHGGTAPGESKGKVGKTILSVIEKVAQSQIVQGAAELGPIKKVVEGISSTPLMLNVQVIQLEGTLALNIPPPPSDRLWFGFRRPPKLSLKAVPQVGDKTVDMTTINNWIESRLHTLLEKNLVVPNMANLVVPLMTGNEMLKFGYNK